jgi:hypothetical protein
VVDGLPTPATGERTAQLVEDSMAKSKTFLLAPVLLLPLGFALAQDTQEVTPTPANATKDDPARQRLLEYSTPGPAHEVLQAKIGKWNTSAKLWMEPDAPPQAVTGTSETSWILDGRFVEETFTGTFDGCALNGRGTTGYDNIKQKYVSSWVDNLATGILASEGSYDPGTKTFNFVGQAPDPISGRYVPMRFVEKLADTDRWTVEMFMPGPDGKEFKSMEIVYTRAK